jgi:hypothetical protein
LANVQVRLFQAIDRKGSAQVYPLGVVDISVQDTKRNTQIEQWLPIFRTAGREPGILGDLGVQLKLTELVALPLADYTPLISVCFARLQKTVN